MKRQTCFSAVLMSLVLTMAAVVPSFGSSSPASGQWERLPAMQGESADLAIGTDGPEAVPVGRQMVFHIVVTNNGPGAAARVAVVDILPEGVTFVSARVSTAAGNCGHTGGIVACDLGAVDAGASLAIEIGVHGPLRPGDVTNHVFVVTPTPDPNPSNDTDFWTTTVLPLPPDRADLRMTKAGPGKVSTGAVFSYTLDVFNLGGAEATQLTVTDTLPLSTTFLSASASTDPALCDHTDGVVRCVFGALAPYHAHHVTVTVQAPAATGAITNEASVTASEVDPDLADNLGSVTTLIVTAPSVTSTTPADGATGVATDATISATFSEPVDPTTLSASTFTLVRQGETAPVTATVSYSSAINTALLKPDAALAAGTTYTVTIKGGMGGVTNLAGTPLAADVAWSFTTEAPGAGVIALPGRFEVENYRVGGAGVGYHDTTPGNSGGVYRMDDVDIQMTADSSGAYNVGWVRAGEWLAYNVNVSRCGFYLFTVRVATPYSDRRMHIEIGHLDVTGPVELPNTSGWQTWADLTLHPIGLPAGDHQLRLIFDTSDLNINYVVVEAIPAAGRISAETGPFNKLQIRCAATPAGDQGFYLPFIQK